MSRSILLITSIVLALLLGFVGASWWYAEKSTHTEIRAQGVLEQVNKVFELVTVNGHFSEIYDYKDYYYYDWSITSKKALVKVKAKVSMGFDLSEVEIELLDQEKRISINSMPEVKLLSMDIQETFYDIQQGAFNSFQPSDYNKIKKDIRALIESKAYESALAEEARDQLLTLLQGLNDLMENYGWTIQVETQPTLIAPQADIQG